MSKFETAIRLVLDYHQALNRRDVPAMLQFLSPECVFEQASPAPQGTRSVGRQEAARFWEEFFRQQPDAHFEIEEIFSLGERCVLRWRLTGADPARQPLRGVDIYRVTGGAICELHAYVKG